MLGSFEFKSCNIFLRSAKHPQITRMLSNNWNRNVLTNARPSAGLWRQRRHKGRGAARPAELRSAIWPQAIFSFNKPRGALGGFSEIVSTCWTSCANNKWTTPWTQFTTIGCANMLLIGVQIVVVGLICIPSHSNRHFTEQNTCCVPFDVFLNEV